MKKLLRKVSRSSLALSPNRSATSLHPSAQQSSSTQDAVANNGSKFSSTLAWNQEGYLLHHLNSVSMKQGCSEEELLFVMRNSRNEEKVVRSVHLQLTNGLLIVTDLTGHILIEEDVVKLIMCIQDLLSKDVQDCIGIVLPGCESEHHLHIFQAMSSREAGVIVQHLSHALHRKVSGISDKLSRSQSSASGSDSSGKRQDVAIQSQAVKKRHHSAQEMGVSGVVPPTTMVRTYGQSSSQQLVSDKNQRTAVAALTNTSVKTSKDTSSKEKSRANRHSIGAFLPEQKRHVSVKRVGSLGRETTLSAEECIVRVSRGADRVKDSNKKLVIQCRTVDVNSPFGEALKAIFENDLEVLGRLLNSESLSIETGDDEGNSLLHYAVACQRNEVVKLLCERGAYVDSGGFSATRPLHRAGVEGLVSVVHTLLERGASPNDLDSNLRSPLHFTAAVEDHLECTYALLERGARIYQKDALGVRPFDLNNSLKDMQSGLVTSACETFSATLLKDYEMYDMGEDNLGTVSSPTGTPNVSQLFPWGSRDRSLSSGSSSQGPAHPTPGLVRHGSQPSLSCESQHGSAVSLLPSKSGSIRLIRSESTGSLDQIVKLAHTRAHKLKAKLSKMKELHVRLSSTEIFLEADEDEMKKQLRREKLKFPSDINIASTQIGIDASEMEQKLNDLLRFGILEGRRKQKEKQMKDAKKRIIETEAAIDIRFGSHVKSDRGSHDNQVSSHGEPHPAEEHRTKETEQGSRKGSGSHTSSDTLVNTIRHDNSETESIMTTSTQAMSRVFSDLKKAIEYERFHSQIKAVASGNSEENIPMISIAKHPLHHVPRYKSSKKDASRVRPETDSVFNEIMANLQEDLPSLAAEKQQSQTQTNEESKKSQTRPTLGPKVDLESSTSATSIGRRRSSSALVANANSRNSVPLTGTHPRSMSFTSSGSSTALVPSHQHRRSSSQPFSMAPNEPGAMALRGLIMLSSNEECLGRLIQYVSLPQFSTRLVTLAMSTRSSCGMLANIATFMQNLYEVGGSEGRKRAVESGILSITVKLLRARDPIPGTMLQLLYSLLFSEEDPTNYLRAIARIPIAPLLAFLEPEDKDSGFENRHRDTSLSTPPSGSLERSRSSTRVVSPELVPGDNRPARPREDSDGSCKNPDNRGSQMKSNQPSSREGLSTSGIETHSSRTDSFRSDPVAMATTDSGSSSRSLTTPTLHGQSMTFSEARRIALKLFAALSVYDKLHKELGDARVISLLVENLTDVSQENVTNAVMTLSNIAKDPNTHPLMLQCGVVEKLEGLLSNGPTIRHHAAKTMVYLGEMNTRGISVFHRSNGYESEEVMFKESKEDQQIWGGTLEHLVCYLIEDPEMLWNSADEAALRVGGFPHPHSPSQREITRFFLVTMRSFVDPLIFLRLLLHRITSDESFLGLDGLEDEEQCFELSKDVVRALSIIEQWMQDSVDGHCSDDFTAQPILQKEVVNLIQLLKQTKGFYVGIARNMKKLLDNMGRPRASSILSVNSERVPHHDHLYPVCQKMIVEGLLPITLEQVVMMGGLQLHIESLMDPGADKDPKSSSHAKMKKKSSASHLAKRALPIAYQKHKNIAKRLLEEKAKYAGLSERNSKHLYIEKCQSIPGYDYQFFEVTLKPPQTPSGSFFKKPRSERRLLGISDKQLILLDERTKHVLSQFSLKDVVKVARKERSSCTVMVKLKDTQFHFVLEDERRIDEVLLLLERCEENQWEIYKEIGAQDDLDDFDPGWSQQLQTSQFRTLSSSSLNSSPSGSVKDLVNDLLKPAALGMDHSGNGGMSGDDHVTSGQDVEAGDVSPWKHDRWQQMHEMCDSDDDSNGEVQFQCDCPEDPELGPDLQLADIDVQLLLHYPMELARQITLIDHELLCSVSPADVLHKIRMAPKQFLDTRPMSPSVLTGSSTTLEQIEGNIEKLAFRFNQIGNWVASSILFFDIPEERADVIARFINTAKHCFEMRNYSAVMAIVVLGLGSPSIRRLKLSWEGVSKKHKEFLKKMNELLDSKLNYSKYRDMLANTSHPAIPYFGVFMKDLTQIVENNPDYIKGGLINLLKRKQIYKALQEMMSFKRQKYNFLSVQPIRDYLSHTSLVPEDTLHELSHRKEPKASITSATQSSNRSSRGSLSSLVSFSSSFLRRFRHASIDSIAGH